MTYSEFIMSPYHQSNLHFYYEVTSILGAIAALVACAVLLVDRRRPLPVKIVALDDIENLVVRASEEHLKKIAKEAYAEDLAAAAEDLAAAAEEMAAAAEEMAAAAEERAAAAAERAAAADEEENRFLSRFLPFWE